MIFSRFFLSALFTLAIGIGNAPAADKPNIIFILADDLGYGDIGCFGQKKILTPEIDKMATEGMKLTDGLRAFAFRINDRSAHRKNLGAWKFPGRCPNPT